MARADDHWSEIPPDGVSTLRHYVLALWRRKWVFLAPLVLLPTVMLVATLRQHALYEASADVLVNRQEVATTSLIGQTPALEDPFRAMETQKRLARVPLVLERAAVAAHVPRTSADTLQGKSSVSSVADILRFTVSNEDPARAAVLAGAYAREFVRYRRQLDTVGLAGTLAEVRRQIEALEAAARVSSPLYVRLADREQQLESLRALRVSNVSVVQTDQASDAEKVAPRPRRNTALGVVGGFVVGLVLVFFWESLGTRPRSREEFEALLGMPLLADLGLASQGESSLRADGSIGSQSDAVHTLRANLELANAGSDARSIMVTSAHAGEGKSSIAARLAFALARTGRRVALVDLDLREGSLTQRFGLDAGLGVTSIARGECELAEALVAASLDIPTSESRPVVSNDARSSAPRLEVLGTGPRSLEPAEVVTSNAIASLVGDLEQRADVVLVDVPPLLEAPDAASVTTAIGGLLLVVSSHQAHGPNLAETRRTIANWPLARLGFVLTHGDETRSIARPLPARSSITQVAEPEQVA